MLSCQAGVVYSGYPLQKYFLGGPYNSISMNVDTVNRQNLMELMPNRVDNMFFLTPGTWFNPLNHGSAQGLFLD